jgi:hypothetical protein
MVVRLNRNEGVIRIEVDDASATAPVLEHPGPDDENGRGMFLVAALAARSRRSGSRSTRSSRPSENKWVRRHA